MKEVAEGVHNTRSVRELAASVSVEMPITEQMYQLIYEKKPPRQVVTELMTRACGAKPIEEMKMPSKDKQCKADGCAKPATAGRVTAAGISRPGSVARCPRLATTPVRPRDATSGSPHAGAARSISRATIRARRRRRPAAAPEAPAAE
jgi:hypothetical protein